MINKNHQRVFRNLQPRNKKGISGIVSVAIMIALVVVAATIVWTVVKNTIEGGTEEREACFGNFEKIGLDPEYTCYNPDTNKVQFTIKRGNVNLDSAIVLVSAGGAIKSYELTKLDRIVPELGGCVNNGLGIDLIKLPGKTEGTTYVTFASAKPESIKLAPTIEGVLCDISASITNVPICYSRECSIGACVDSDDPDAGEIKGICTAENGRYEDSCDEDGKVVEWSCPAEVCISSSVDCSPGSCNEGICTS